LTLVKLDPQWRAFFEDGEIINVWGDLEQMKREIHRVSPGDVAGYDRFRAYARRMYQLSERFFFWRSVGGVRDLMQMSEMASWEGLKTFLQIDMLSTVTDSINRHFKNSHLRQILEHFIQYVGSSPELSPAILCAIHHIQLEFGVWYPLGGTGQISHALGRLATEQGVHVHTNARVESILSSGHRVTGLRVQGEAVSADVVVANSDFVRSHTELLDFPTETTQRIRAQPNKFEPSCSGIVFYVGLNKKYDAFWHHDFFFSNDPAQEFNDIYHRRVPTQDPTLCVCVPSRTDPSVAPEGCENLYILVHTPPLIGEQKWTEWKTPYRDLILNKLERCGFEGIRRHIVTEAWLTPHDIDSNYLVHRGAIYGLASHGRLSGGFKKPNRSSDFENLYFSGGSVNPGPGVPMVLMSGQVAADCVLQDLRGVGTPSNRSPMPAGVSKSKKSPVC
jgi:diapolycopene oxygenase